MRYVVDRISMRLRHLVYAVTVVSWYARACTPQYTFTTHILGEQLHVTKHQIPVSAAGVYHSPLHI